MNHFANAVLLTVALLHLSGMLAEADAAPDFDKRRGWGKRSEDALEGGEADKRRGWGKRADDMDGQQGWGKRSVPLTAEIRGWGKRSVPITVEERGWGKRSAQGIGIERGDLGAFFSTQEKRPTWGDAQATSQDIPFDKQEAKRRGWGKRSGDICEELNDKIYAHVSKAIEVCD